MPELGAATYRVVVDGKAVPAEMAVTEKAVNKSTAALATKFTTLGSTLTRKVSLPIAATMAGSLLTFASFDDAITQSLAIMKDVTPQMRSELESVAKQLSTETKFSATELATAMYDLASAGIEPAAIAAGGLETAAKFAQAGMVDMGVAADYLANSQAALGLSFKDPIRNAEAMRRVSDNLVQINNMATGTVEEFAKALTTKSAGAMHQLGMEMEEGIAILGAFAQVGVRGEEAGTQLSMVLRDLQNASIKNKDAWESMGLSVFDASGEMRPFADIIDDLNKKLGSMTDEQRRAALMQLGFTDRSVGATQAILQQADVIREYEKELKSAAGVTDEVAKKQMESFKNQMLATWHEMQKVGIAIGELVAPTVLVLAKALATVLGWLLKLPGPIKVLLGALAGVAAVIGPSLLLYGKLTKMWKDMVVVAKQLAASKVGATLIGWGQSALQGMQGITLFGRSLTSVLGIAGIAVGAGLVLGFLTKKLIEWHYAAKEKAAKATEELGNSFVKMAQDGGHSADELGDKLDELRGKTEKVMVAMGKGAGFKEVNVEARALANGGVSVTTAAFEALDEAVMKQNISSADAVAAYQAILGEIDPMRGDLEHAQVAFKRVADQMASGGKVGRSQYITMLVQAGYSEKAAAKAADALGLSIKKVQTRTTATGKTIRLFAGMTAAAFDEWRKQVTSDLNAARPALDKLAGKAKVSANAIKKAFQQQANQFKQYAKNLKSFANLNIPEELKKQVIDMGVEGSAIMKGFSKMSKEELREVSDDFKSGQKAIDSTKGTFDGLASSAVPDLQRVADETRKVGDELNRLPNNVTVDVWIRQHGGVPNVEPKAKGMNEVVNRPRLLLVGEKGPEHVRVTPLSGSQPRTMGRSGGMGSTGRAKVVRFRIENWEEGIGSMQLMMEDEIAEASMYERDRSRMGRAS